MINDPPENDPTKQSQDQFIESVDTYFAQSGDHRVIEPEIIPPGMDDSYRPFDVILDDSYYREVQPPQERSYRNETVVPPVHGSAIYWKWPLFLYLATWISVTAVGGLLFAVGVMTILTCHEFGHYFQTRRYRVFASLPYFIPFPSIFGTMGAIIKMDSRIPHTKALFDIGISGPLAGLVPTLIFCYIGVQSVEIIPLANLATNEWLIEFGYPLLIQWGIELFHGPIPADSIVRGSSLYMAGWFGLFLTCLNLIPIGQLDGGHVFYALLKRRAPALSTCLFFGIIVYVMMTNNWMWTPMIIILFLMNPRHPPTQNDRMPIGLWRVVLGWSTLAFLFVGFTLNPIIEIPPTQNATPPQMEDNFTP